MDPISTAAPDHTAADLAAAMRRLARSSVLVIGDAMLDRYVYGEVERISPEAPVPVLAVQREIALPGGAGNVVRNLGALGAAVAFISVVGDDQAGSDLTGLIGGQPGVEPWLLVQGSRITTMKTRFVAQGRPLQGHQLLRADREDTRPINPRLMDRMLRIARDAMVATSVTILSDYRKGVLADEAPASLIAAARQAGRRVVADVHGHDYARYAGTDVIVVASRDLGLAVAMPVDSDAAVAAAGDALRLRHGFGAVLIMRNEDGMTLVDAQGAMHFPVEAAEVFDISGTGDTAVATLGAGLACGLDLRLAVRLANIAAGVVVGKMGTAVARESDLLAAISPQAGALRKIVTTEAAAERAERWRRNGWRTGFTHGCFGPLRPGHVHLLEQARGACDRLIVAVDSDAVVRRNKGEARPLQPEPVRAARLASLPCVDLVVVNTEDTPAELLRALRPDLLVNGADRPPEQMAGADLLEEWGGRVMLAEMLPEATGD
ncbi:bifunctional heptose 7-phosphate kinase/heptose 1-phosphate adenyltransferase [Limobrevibacterium gyesilva]|uniref:Bifunctional protein HldE n=1 Tax=Limobrevibacterium gyesilva TaxID=2991712 RepID=A0AA42CEE5_9PROT|nr:bifunctional heptose 7-phosphate kinase/heptose 1-phosphate adenyltransferase [Limobrevibacterium gyesilva]MCW3473416.1 bifunctional heptose 7-phosphate kinase/heptose 1-phosphate adenyltransferase [Limobrevibacterium gyesilva]